MAEKGVLNLKSLKDMEEGKKEEAAKYLRDVHWSFQVQEKFIKRYYKRAVAASKKKDE
jgi:hypothetical protein